MSFRPLLLFFGLAAGDYLLWNWSLNGNHDVIALVSGLSLPPLSVAFLWLLVMAIARLAAHSTKRPAKRASAARARARQRARATQPQHGHTATAQGTQAASTQASPSTRRIAA